MTSKTPFPLRCILVGILGLVACAGPTSSTVSPTTTQPAADRVAEENIDLVRLVSVLHSHELNEGAIIQMLAFRELVYLPFASRGLYDARLLDLSEDRSELTAGFTNLGGAGQQALELCALEAFYDLAEFVHLPGDDNVLLARACLEMIGDAYGVDGLAFLVSFATIEPSPNPDALLLQRAALDVIQQVAPDVDVWRANHVADWRYEVDHWANFLKQRDLELSDVVYPFEPAACDEMCETILFFQWVTSAARTINRLREDEAAPRQLMTLRAFVERRAERWGHWLEEASTTIIYHGRGEISPEEVQLVVELWLRAAAVVDLQTCHENVLPLVAWSIDPTEIERHTDLVEVPKDGSVMVFVNSPTTSQLLVRALEDATGLTLEHPSCAPGAMDTPDSIHDCLMVQAAFWREMTLLRRWEI